MDPGDASRHLSVSVICILISSCDAGMNSRRAILTNAFGGCAYPLELGDGTGCGQAFSVDALIAGALTYAFSGQLARVPGDSGVA